MRKKLLALFAIAGAAAGSAAAQPAAAPQQSTDIVVEGRRDVDRQIGEFVRALTDVPMSGQISRFDWAVCPMVAGLSDQHNMTAAKRMRDVARAAGIKVGEIGCKPNVLLVVTDDKSKLIDRLRSEQPAFFQGVPPAEMRLLRRGDGPAVAWHIEGLLDNDGVEVARDRETDQYVVERTDVPSRISTGTRPHFAAAVVVVDSDALAGLTVVQLADYAAMRAYARTDPARLKDSPAPTVLTVLDAPMGSEIPLTLTRWDFAYLKSLYASAADRTAGQQRGEMRREIERELGNN